MASGKFDWTTVGGRAITSPQNMPQSQGSGFDWASVGGRLHSPRQSPQESMQEQQPNLDELKKQHPLMYKIAEHFQNSPGLEKAGNIAGHVKNIVEGTGLPSAAKGFFETGINAGRGIANLIPGVKIPEQKYNELNVNPYVGQGAETVGSLGMGLPLYRGYQGIKSGISSLPHAQKIPEIIRSMIAGGTLGSAISPEHRGLGGALGVGAELVPAAIQGTKNFISGHNPLSKEKELYKAIAEHEMQKSGEESLKNKATHEFGKSNPEALLLSAKDKEAELKAAENYKRHHIGEEKQLPGQQLIPEAEHGIKNVNEALKHTLGEGEPHSQKLSEHIVNAIEGQPVVRPHPKTGLPQQVREGGLREEIGKKYDELENNLPNVKIPVTADMKAVEKELEKFTTAKANLSEEQKESFRKVLAATHPSAKSKEMDGKAFFRAYRSLRKMEGDQRSKAFGLSPKEHDEWIERANQTKNTYEDMEKIINEHFPEGTIKKLHEINHEYSTKVAPLHENPMYQAMLKHGQYAGNIIDSLSGTTKGNDILNNMIRNNADLSRLALGHSFAGSPEKLLKPNQSIEPFVRANPQISELMGLQKQAHGELEAAKKTAEMHKQVAMIPKLAKEIREQQAIAKKLQTESEITGITKSEVIKRKIEYEKAQKKLRTLMNRLIGASLITGTGKYVTRNINEG